MEVTLGRRYAAGVGVATTLPDLDFETYSEAGYVWDETARKWRGPPGAPKDSKGLSVVGVEPYVRHPTFEILSMAYDLKDGLGKRLWLPGMPLPADLFSYLQNGGLLEAWNVSFERWVWELHCVEHLGWPVVRPEQWRCAMAKARASAWPGALGEAGRVMHLPIQKDPEGDRLLKLFSVPQNPTKKQPAKRLYLGDRPEDGYKLLAYNGRDIEAEECASLRIPDLEGEELRWWQVHEAINRRGVHVDRVGIENCIAIIEQAHAKYNAQLFQITGIDAASKVQQLQGWLHGRGLHLDSLDEESVEAALKMEGLPPDVRRVLEIRAAVGSASVKKAFAMRNRLSADSRLRDLYVYCGARTGRSTGEGPQPTNLPKAGPDCYVCVCGKHYAVPHDNCPWCGFPRLPTAKKKEWNPKAAEDALEIIASRSLAMVEYVFGDAMHAVAGCLRALFTAGPGNELISTDFNSIEAVGLAMISGETWRIEVFRTHGKIYETSASMMYRIPLEEILGYKAIHDKHHPLRQKGKIAELAFGYQGWLGAAKAFEMPGTDEEIKADILAWRRASPAIEWLWGGQTVGKSAGILENAGAPSFADRWDRTPHYFGVEGMALAAMTEPETMKHVMRLDGTYSGVSFLMRGDALYCLLPSGRWLTYHRPRAVEGDRGLSLSYEGWNTNPKNGPYGWIRMNTWGGRLVENINQATCRDILRFCCINLEDAGYPVVLHTYDEPASEVPVGFGSTEEYERIAERRPAWAHDWPIKAPGAYRAFRYRKAG